MHGLRRGALCWAVRKAPLRPAPSGAKVLGPVMKEGIHPEYVPAHVVCACGNTFTTRSTRGDFGIDVCSACHPFYTGTQKLIDTAGRVDRFRKRYEKSAKAVAAKAEADRLAGPEAGKAEAAAADAPTVET